MRSNTPNPILQVRNLCVQFGQRTVVDDVSYTLHRGETLGIVGESGSGKSISTLSLMGLLPVGATSSGEAWLGGKDAVVGDRGTNLLQISEDEMRKVRGKRISMIFQEPMTSLNPVRRCGEQVMEMMRGDGKGQEAEQKERVLELLREVLLPRPEKVFESYPHEISGGQKQRVMIAMALAAEPDILIADEPTTALDVTVQRTILDLLRDLQRKHGTSIIFITHDLGVIAQVAERIMVMYRGRVVEQGTATEVLHHPQEAYTQGLLACRPPLQGHPHRLPTVEEYLKSGAEGQKSERAEGKKSEKSEGQSSVHQPLKPSKPQNPAPPLLSVRNLAVNYTLERNLWGKPLQQLRAVDGVSFDIVEGETLGLVGESGCGKSTLGRALLQLIDHSEGEIMYRGQRIDQLTNGEKQALRTKLQIIFQDPYSSLNPRLSIGQAIAEPLRVHTKKPEGANWKEIVIDLMEQVGLQADWFNRYPHQLSGGQRQRVCIARSLVLQPELVICDESVSALDVSVQAQVLNLLNDLKERHHYTYLFITHDLSVVHYMADRIMVMQKGRIVESGTPDQLFHHPQTPYTQTLIDAIPRI